MTEVIELKPYLRISDLKLNHNYLGNVLSESLVALNTNVIGKLQKPTELEKGSKVAVKVIKIFLPYNVELEIVSGSFKVIEEGSAKEFFIKSEILEKLKPSMIKAAELVKKSISDSRPIILKHHADCDGYIGAMAIERAISSLLAKAQRNAVWHYYKRTPIRAPYYDYTDAIKDLTIFLNDIKNQKPPLLILVDNGSTTEDLLALKKVEQYGLITIVIDHHKPTIEGKKPIVEDHIEVFINPYSVGGDNSLTAGMIGVELSRLINKTSNIEHLPAIAGMCDKSKGKDFEQYLEIAKKKGYDNGFIKDIGQCIDFEAFHIGYMDSGLIEEILFNEIEQQKEYVNLIKEELEKTKKALIVSVEKYAKIKEMKGLDIIEIDIQETLNIGSFPPPGKSMGICFDYFQQKTQKPLFVFGHSSDYITIRSNIKGFDLNKMMEELSKKLPYAQLCGGGHELAGTIRFIDAAKQEVYDLMIKYLKDKHESD